MSKSWKRRYVWTDCVSSKGVGRWIRTELKRFPTDDLIPNGNWYRNLIERWDFRDYKFSMTEADVRKSIEDDLRFRDELIEKYGPEHGWAKRYYSEEHIAERHKHELANFSHMKKFPRYWRRDRKRARRMKGAA